MTAKRDIVFLIDGSDDVRNRFPSIKEFVARIVNQLDIGRYKDQVAIAQFSNTAVTNFNLNTHTSTNEVVNAVQNLKPKGGGPQYIGLALQHVKDKVLTLTNGSRDNEGVKQILVLVASGRSRDSARGAASILKNAGVLMYVIGSGLTDHIEMEAISSHPDYVYAVSDFYNLQNIQESLLAKLADEKTAGVEGKDTFSVRFYKIDRLSSFLWNHFLN